MFRRDPINQVYLYPVIVSHSTGVGTDIYHGLCYSSATRP